MRRVLGFGRTGITGSKRNIWLLSVCYQVAQDGDNANSSCSDLTRSEGFATFIDDFSSQILIAYMIGIPYSQIKKILEEISALATSRTWESLLHSKRDGTEYGESSNIMAIHLVSSDEDGEREVELLFFALRIFHNTIFIF